MILPFALEAARAWPPVEELALAMAAEFGPVRADEALAALDDLAEELAPARGLDALDQADACAEVLGHRHRFRVAADNSPAQFMLDGVLRRRSGHPAALAVVYVAAAARAGLPFAPVGVPARHLVAHRDDPRPVVLDPARAGGLVTAAELPPGVRRRCAHEAIFALLGELIVACGHSGDVAGAIRAAELRLELPVDGPVRERLDLELRRLRARLN